MPTKEELETALQRIATRVREPDIQERLKGFKRDVVITFTDLHTSYLFNTHNASVGPIIPQERDKNQVEVITDSATFLGILNGTVNGFSAFASGRLKIHGAISDLLKLQELFK